MQKPVSATLVALVVSLMFLGASVKAQVLQQVPANSLLVIKVNNLGATSAKLGNFFKQLGLVEVNPDFADPMAALKQKAGISQGLNPAGDMAFVMVDTGEDMEPEKSLMILVPVSDYKAFIGNFADAKTEGAVSQATLPGDNETTYFAKWGNYAAMSPSKDLVTAKPGGVVVSGKVAAEINSKDLAIFGNMQAVRAKFMPMLQQERPKLLEQLETHLGQIKDDQKKYAPVLRTLANQGLDAVEALLRDTQGAVVTMNLGQDGISSVLLAEFDPKSYLGTVVGQFKNSNESLLKGLPAGSYLFFGGAVSDPKVTAKVMDDLLTPMLKDLRALGDDSKPIIDYIESIRKGAVARSFSSFGMLAPTGMIGADSLVQVLSYAEGDSAAMLESQREQLKIQTEAMRTLDPNSPQPTVTMTPKAKTMDGVTLDQYQVNIIPDPQNIQEQQAAQMIRMLYGANGFVGYGGPIDSRRFIMVGGVNDVTLGGAIAAAKQGTDVVGATPGVKAVAANLPAKRIAVTYMSLDTLVTTVVNYARQFGFPVPIQLPPDQPPIGTTIATDGSSVRIDSYIPTQLIQSLVTAGIQAYQSQMQPPGGPGAPPPGPGL